MGNKKNTFIHCANEHDILKRVVMTPPKHMKITEIINETQSHYVEENINIEIAMEQYRYLVIALEKEGITIEELSPIKELNEQVFTRDIGFVIGEKLFVSHMKREIRQKEVEVLKDWLSEEDIAFEVIHTPSIEGGDVLLDNNLVWVGVSDRTSPEAIDEFQTKLPHHTVKTIPLRKDILHLDCAFNIIDHQTALLYPDAIDQEVKNKLHKQYRIIEVTEEEQFHMGPNVLAIGENKLISLPENKRINKELTKAGYTVIEVPFSEIIKSGGSYRCCTLPLIRQ